MSNAETQKARKTPQRPSKVPSVEKALDIFELLAGEPTGLTLQHMTERLDRTMGEIYRITVYLSERGYLKKNAMTDEYTLTLRLFELANRQDPTQRLVKTALREMESITRSTEQSCHLATLYGSDVVVLASQSSPRHAGYSVRTGAKIEFRRTSSGPVILAFMAEEDRNRHLAELSTLERAHFIPRIQTIIENGYEDRPSTFVNGVRNISVPIFDAAGVAAALTMGFINQADLSASPDQARHTLMASADRISENLGHIKT